MNELERHPLSALWGDMPENEFEELVQSIKTHGQLTPIVLLDGKVLDGWNRYTACVEVGLEPRTQTLSETADPASYVIALNATRRHLTASQRVACVVAAREWRPVGRPKKQESDSYFPEPASEEQMAEEGDASVRLVRQAKRAERAGLGQKVRSGEMSLNEAERIARGDDPKPKPTKVERLESKVEALESEVGHLSQQNMLLRQEIDEQADLIKFHEGNLSEQEHERYAAYQSLQAQLSTAKTQINTWMNKYNDELSSRKYWERQAKRLGWEPA